MSQVFRFCCRCVRMTLVQDRKCFFCNGKFILHGLNDNSIEHRRRKKERLETN